MFKSVKNFFDRFLLLQKAGVPFLFVIDFDIINPLIFTFDEASSLGVIFDINGVSNTAKDESYHRPEEVVFSRNPPSFTEYLRSYEIVRNNLRKGNSYLVNLTCSTELMTNLKPIDFFMMAEAPYRLLLGDIAVFSPEPFVKVSNGEMSTCPMKGTISAAISAAAERLMENEKELAEHVTVVDLLRNDLAMVADRVRVERFRYVERVKTASGDLFQTSSLIKGELKKEYRDNLGRMLLKLLPAGSVTGAPKRKTVEIIRSAETHERGYYTGVFGYCCGDYLDSAVMIRFVEERDGKIWYKSGGGITAYSSPEEEYTEMCEKIYVPFY